MPASTAPYFDPNLISTTYYINPDDSQPRREGMEQAARDLDLENLVRVPGIRGESLTGAERADVIARVKIDPAESGPLHQQAGTTPDSPEGKKLEEHLALGKYGCHASHLKAMQTALANVKPGDENKWVVILEDDAKLFPEERDRINSAVANAPQDAGAIMLAGLQFHFKKGFVPISTENDDLAAPMYAHSCLGIAYRPEMLRTMVKVYEKNLGMSAEEGGISPIDDVNCNMQLAGHGIASKTPEYRALQETFAQASEANPRNKFYLLNPGGVYPNGAETLIGSNPDADAVYYHGHKLTTFPEDIALQLPKTIADIQDVQLRKRAGKTIHTTCVEGGDPQAAWDTVQQIASADRMVKPREEGRRGVA